MESHPVLLIQHHPANAQEIAQRIERAGFSLAGRLDGGADALEAVAANQPALVAVSDDGAHLSSCRRIGREISTELGIPVVYLIGPGNEVDATELAELDGAYGVLVAPYDERQLETTLRLALTRAQREAKFRVTESTLATVFESFPKPMLLVKTDGIVTMCNRQVQQVFGSDCGDGRRRPLHEIVRCAKQAGEDRCVCTVPCDRCELIGIVREAVERSPVENRICRIGIDDDGIEREVVLCVSAIGLADGPANSQAVVVLEDQTDVERLRMLYEQEHSFAGIVGRSAAMRRVFTTIREVADVEMPVLIQGETGTGKELVARAIHSCGPRRERALVPVNCGAIPESLLESELFGHEKGAFTGAVRRRQGRFTLANGGTIFLDEIGDLSPTVQVKLLRVLQEGTFEPVGSEETHVIDVRIISASNKDLTREVEAGRFREDLYYRLAVLPIELPPLRERRDDIPLIADHLLNRAAVANRAAPGRLSAEVVSLLLDDDWRGNVRELDNVLQFARMKAAGEVIQPHHLPPTFGGGPQSPPPPDSTPGKRIPLDRKRVSEAIDRAGGNRTRAAKLLGISRATLYRFLSKNPISDGRSS